MPHDHDQLLSVASVAREIGIDRSTLAKQVRSGAVRSYEGKVRLSEVLEDRAANIDLSRSRRHGGAIDELPIPEAIDHAADLPQPEEVPAENGVLVDGAVLPYAEARAMKETYIARLRKLEFDKERGELAPVAEMVAFNERIFGVIRERLLAIPGKLSGDLDAEQVERVTAEIHEALEELSDPKGGVTEVDPADEGDPDYDQDEESAAKGEHHA